MENHLFIGLGGFGGQTLREIRKCAHLNKELVEQKSNIRFNVDYLYCDSSMDICKEAMEWRVLGEDVSLDPRDLIDLKDGKVSTSFHDVDRFPHISSWLGSKESIAKYLKAAGNGPGANQRRRFGRYLFASNAERFLDKVRSKVSTQGRKAECTFHIFATLAGGTGSGALIDAITIIRNEYPDESRYPIFVYGYTTDRKQDGKADVGYFYPNQYAVIRDLNALMVGKYTPQILSEDRICKTDADAKYVEAVYLITPENKNSVIYQPKDQVKLVGNWAYQRVMSEVFGYIPATVKKAFTGEDILSEYLGEPGEKSGEPERSARFGSIGLKRWGIPEEETQEAFICDYLTQAFAQMTYGIWDSENGYEARGESFSSKEANILNEFGLDGRSAWNLSKVENHLSYRDEWRRVAEDFEFDGNLKGSIKDLVREFEEHSSQKFRGTGVNSYFQARLSGGLTQQVEKFESFLRQWIDSQWLEGKAGIKGLIAELTLLVNKLDGKLGEFDVELSVKSSSINSIEKRWKSHADKPGWLAKSFGIEKTMYEKFSSQIVDAYEAETTLRGVKYGISLCKSMRESVISISNSLSQTDGMLLKILKGFQKDRLALLNYAEGGEVKSGDLGQDQVEFNESVYKDIWTVMRRNRNQVDALIGDCRKSVLQGQRSLITLHAIRPEDIIESVEKLAEDKVKYGHDKACEKDPNLVGKHILGKNIWEIFEESSVPELKGRVNSFLEGGVTIAKRSKDRILPGSPNIPLEHNILLNPAYSGSRKVELEEMFRKNDVPLHFVEHDNPSEILCLSVDAAAPARLFNVVHQLEKEYQKKIATDDGKYFIHLDPESEDQTASPSVVIKD